MTMKNSRHSKSGRSNGENLLSGDTTKATYQHSPETACAGEHNISTTTATLSSFSTNYNNDDTHDKPLVKRKRTSVSPETQTSIVSNISTHNTTDKLIFANRRINSDLEAQTNVTPSRSIISIPDKGYNLTTTDDETRSNLELPPGEYSIDQSIIVERRRSPDLLENDINQITSIDFNNFPSLTNNISTMVIEEEDTSLLTAIKTTAAQHKSITPNMIQQYLQFQCRKCIGVFTTYDTFVQHLELHLERYVCVDCDKVFWDKASLKQHQKKHSNGEETVIDNQKMFQMNHSLKRELDSPLSHELPHSLVPVSSQISHTLIPIPPDDLQMEIVADQSTINNHSGLENVTTKQTINTRKGLIGNHQRCQNTNPTKLEPEEPIHHARSSTPSNYKSILTSNSPVLQKQKNQCTISSNNKISPSSPPVLQEQQQHQCTVCGKTMTTAVSLKKHYCWMHPTSLLPSPFPYADNKEERASTMNLTKQYIIPDKVSLSTPTTQTISGDTKLHQCSECEKAFAYKGNLNRHQRVHSQPPQFECHICHKRFNHRFHVLKHEAKTHNYYGPLSVPIESSSSSMVRMEHLSNTGI